MRTDDEIFKEVSHILHTHPGLDSTNILISVKEGVVALSGSVHSSIAKWMAKEAIKHISGIKDIDENLEIKPLADS